MVTLYRASDLSHLSVNWSNPVNRNHPLGNPLSWWLNVPHWQGGTVWRDLMGLNHGTLTNMNPASDWVSAGGRLGGWGALNFPGADDKVVVGIRGLQQQYPMTLSAAIKPTLGATQCAFSNDGDGTENWSGLAIFVNSDGKIQALAGNNVGSGTENRKSITTTTTISDGVWVTIDVVFNSHGDTDIYFDSILQGTTSSGGSEELAYAGTDGQIGFDDSSSDFPYTGLIDDVQIRNIAFSAAAIARRYELSLLGYPELLNRIGQPMSTEEIAAADGTILPQMMQHNHLKGRAAV